MRHRFTELEKIRAVERIDAGESYKSVCGDIGASQSSVVNWRKTYSARTKDDVINTNPLPTEDLRPSPEMANALRIPDPDVLANRVLHLVTKRLIEREDEIAAKAGQRVADILRNMFRKRLEHLRKIKAKEAEIEANLINELMELFN